MNKPFEIHEISEENYEAIIERYHPLVKKLASQAVQQNIRYGIEYEDVHQVALLAILAAIRSYKPGPVAFGYYLNLIITNNIRSYLRAQLPFFYRKNVEKSESLGKPNYDRIYQDPSAELTPSVTSNMKYLDDYDADISENLVAMLESAEERHIAQLILEERSIRDIQKLIPFKNHQTAHNRIKAVREKLGALYIENHGIHMDKWL